MVLPKFRQAEVTLCWDVHKRLFWGAEIWSKKVGRNRLKTEQEQSTPWRQRCEQKCDVLKGWNACRRTKSLLVCWNRRGTALYWGWGWSVRLCHTAGKTSRATVRNMRFTGTGERFGILEQQKNMTKNLQNSFSIKHFSH